MTATSPSGLASCGEAELLVPKPIPVSNPLPKTRLAVISAIKLTFPIAHTQALPYYNVLVERLAASNGADTGYYSGLAFSLFFMAQLIGMFAWGKISDSRGRIPVLLLGTTGLALFTLLFGLSESLPGLLVNRLFAGLFYGMTGVTHSVVGELSDETNQSIAFPIYDSVTALGYVIGPFIGGTFADPAKQWPDLFTSPIWLKYPYLLPCMVSSSSSICAALLAMFALGETLPSKCTPKKPVVSEESEPLIFSPSTNAIDEVAQQTSKPLSVKELLSIPALRAVILSSGALGFAGFSFDNVFVLMAYSPINQGGLALSPTQIGRALSSMGTLSIGLKLCVPLLLRRFGTLNVFDVCMLVWPVTFALLPVASWVARAAASAQPPPGLTSASREASTTEWAVVAFVFFLSRIGCMAFSIIMILTRDHAPGSASLGTANGLAELAQSLAAALGPSIVSSLFAVSASKHLLGGYLWVVFMVLESGFGSWLGKRIRRYHRVE